MLTEANPILTDRHQKVVDYALRQIQSSPLRPFVEEIYLYGSCARGEQRWDSNVDLLVELKDSFRMHPELKMEMRCLKSLVTTDEISDPETDLKIVIGTEWKSSNMLYYKNILREGVRVWP